MLGVSIGPSLPNDANNSCFSNSVLAEEAEENQPLDCLKYRDRNEYYKIPKGQRFELHIIDFCAFKASIPGLVNKNMLSLGGTVYIGPDTDKVKKKYAIKNLNRDLLVASKTPEELAAALRKLGKLVTRVRDPETSWLSWRVKMLWGSSTRTFLGMICHARVTPSHASHFHKLIHDKIVYEHKLALRTKLLLQSAENSAACTSSELMAAELKAQAPAAERTDLKPAQAS